MTMNEVQIWVLMGVFGTLMFSTMIIITRSFTRTLTAEIGSVKAEISSVRGEIGSLRTEIRAEIGSVRTEVDSVRTEMRASIEGLRAEMTARFETVDVRFAHLDRDITALTKRVMGDA
jgi:hypothetical protein